MTTVNQQNKILEVLAMAIAHKQEYRAVIDFTGEHKGETMLIDFSSCGEPFDDDTICVWSLQKDRDEQDYGIFQSYNEAIAFVLKTLADNEGEIYYETF